MFQIIKQTIKSSAVYGIGSISSKLIGFILLPLYTSYLTTSEYGTLAIIEITSTLLTVVVSLKINAAFFRWYWDKEYKEKKKSILFSSILTLIVVSVALVLPLAFFSEQISLLLFQDISFSYLIILMLGSTALQVIIQLVLYLLQLQAKALFYSVTNTIKLVVSLVLTIIFIVQFNKGIEGIYEALIISQILFLIITAKHLLKNIEFKLEFRIISEMLVYSTPLIFAEISGILLTVSDRYILNYMTSISDVGIYSLGYKISNTIRVLIYSSVMMAVSPLIFQYIDKPNNKRFYSKILTYMAFGVMGFVLFLSIFSKEIIQLVAKQESYWSASSLIPILSFAILFGILKDVSLTGLNITKKTGIIAIVVVIMSIANIFLNILFIPVWGVEGAAYATLIVRIVSFLTFYYYAQKHYQIPYEIKKIALLLTVGFTLIYISTLFADFSFSIQIILKSLLLISFPFILYLFSFFEEVEIISLKKGVFDFIALFIKK